LGFTESCLSRVLSDDIGLQRSESIALTPACQQNSRPLDTSHQWCKVSLVLYVDLCMLLLLRPRCLYICHSVSVSVCDVSQCDVIDEVFRWWSWRKVSGCWWKRDHRNKRLRIKSITLSNLMTSALLLPPSQGGFLV